MTQRTRTLGIVVVVGAASLAAIAVMRGLRSDAPQVDVGDRDVAESSTRRRASSGAPDEPEARPVDPRIAHVPTDLVAATLRRPLVFTGVVEESTGTPPERSGASCRLGLDRTEDPALCRVVFECGSSRLYGDPILHETRCGFDADGALVLLDDPATNHVDHDASLSLEGDVLTIRDDDGNLYGDYSLAVRLESTTPGAPGAR